MSAATWKKGATVVLSLGEPSVLVSLTVRNQSTQKSEA